MTGSQASPASWKALSTMVRLCISRVSRHSGCFAASAQVILGPICIRSWLGLGGAADKEVVLGVLLDLAQAGPVGAQPVSVAQAHVQGQAFQAGFQLVGAHGAHRRRDAGVARLQQRAKRAATGMAVGTAPVRGLPCGLPMPLSSSCCSSSRSCSMRWALSSTRSPSGVRPSKLRPRRTMTVPNSRSSARSALDSAGCVMWQACAARPKCLCSSSAAR